MTNIRYSRPRLITSDDKRYREYVQQFILQRKNHRAMRPPRQRDIFGGQVEKALREWLSQHLSLDDRRILGYEELRGRRASTKYRELDAVVLESHRYIWVFEIKASRTVASLRHAIEQLQETRTILHLLYPHVATTILSVNTGIPTEEEVTAMLASPEPPEKPPATLDTFLASHMHINLITSLDERSHDGKTLDLLCFTVDDIIALAGAENLALDWAQDDDIDEVASPSSSNQPVYSTDSNSNEQDSDDSNNALAAALRRAGLSTE